ncbi:MAG: site-2 protease family protein, partial [Clostridia bacterium]|nr:site-2 protease family protein [Clostridia bacterium]
RYFKNPRRDMALSALAGPVSNFILAFIGVLIGAILTKVLPNVLPYTQMGVNIYQVSLTFFELFAILNIGLGLFNLIPCPPLDGSRIFYVFLPPRYYFGVMKYERYISLAILVLLYTGVLSVPLGYARNLILSGMKFLVGLIPFL